VHRRNRHCKSLETKVLNSQLPLGLAVAHKPLVSSPASALLDDSGTSS